MKIDHTNRVQAMNPYKMQQERYQKQTEQQPAKAKDRVDISKAAKQMQVESPVTAARTEKVEALRKQVEAGEYQVNHKAVAEKFLSYWQSLGSINKHD
ncbi:hypothetical protein GCM10011391_13710 [Pullulanibacillus camelliae]|uniref:Negative regulator of flagellin synthesis n=1 Tax=Pullulanibacillus camelliae TaxID=1707096 RepID=A0A8J2VNQ8_9BACL|nr:flagellar biosynthesis anti-sigma factor FlgM [Pullulanibacillus camelliae]GGE36167.1 hypothetical protein GCM10011391_13710 [Pullulanibacillus camelliae]